MAQLWRKLLMFLLVSLILNGSMSSLASAAAPGVDDEIEKASAQATGEVVALAADDAAEQAADQNSGETTSERAATATVSVPAAVPVTEAFTSKHPVTHEMIAIGDSISAGFIAFTATEPNRGLNPAITSEPPPPGKKWGIRWPAFLESKRNYSWVSGQKIDSISKRLKAWLFSKDKNSNLEWINAAETGALVAHMPRQMRESLKKNAKKNPKAEVALVTLMIGANDACSKLDTKPEEAAKIRADMRTVFQTLSAGRPAGQKTPIRVSVSSLPRITELGSEDILTYPWRYNFSCRNVRRKIVNQCPRLTSWKNEDELRIRRARVDFINDTLRDTTLEAQKDFPKLSIAWDTTFSTLQFEGADLAADCFHPGMRGQAWLAESIWRAMPWF